MIGLIPLDIFAMDVGVFASDEDRVARLAEEGCGASDYNPHCLSSAHRDFTAGGEPRFSMVIKPGASAATLVHECCHIADFVMDTVGIPLGIKNTEIRAYLVAYLFARLEELMEGQGR